MGGPFSFTEYVLEGSIILSRLIMNNKWILRT